MNPSRAWFYFRHGYAYYIASILSPINTILLLVGFSDKLGIDSNVLSILIPFIILTAVPLVVLVGYTHYRKAYKNEVDVMVKNNPYHYRLMEGHQQEVSFPLFLELVKYLKILNPTDENRQKRLGDLEKKIQYLIDGNDIKSFKND